MCMPSQLDILHFLKMLIFWNFFINFCPDVHLLYVENILFLSPIVAELTALECPLQSTLSVLVKRGRQQN